MELFPAIEPYHHEFLKVSSIHEIYFEEVGNKDGVPIIFCHGGPGGGLVPKYRQFFDPKHYRIILFDQRGAGKSKPHAELEENTTWDLVRDMEMIRKHLGIRHWLVFGGSWGSTLALSYAVTNPTKVLGLILRGIFLCRPKEISWFYQDGASYIFPDAWQEYYKLIPAEERDNMVAAYYRRLTSEDEKEQLAAALAWSKWEASTSKLFPDPELIQQFEDPKLAIAFARIECHYFMNNAFFETNNYLIEQVNNIRHIPGVIVQGRYDVVCPIISAWDLHQAWPEAEFHIIGDAGHSAWEKGITTKLMEATEKFKKIIYEP